MLGKNRLIAHQVLFTFNDGISWECEEAILAEQVTLNHANEISEIKGWFCGRSVIDRKQAVDFSLIGYFDSYQGLNEYIHHPDHEKGVALWKEISTWTVSDIVVDSGGLINFLKSIKIE